MPTDPEAMSKEWVVPVLTLGLLMVGAGFSFVTYLALDTLVHAVRHAGYYSSGRDVSGSWYSSSGPPTYGDAGWTFLLGPFLQIVVFGLPFLIMTRRRASWRRRLGVGTITLLIADIALGVMVLSTTPVI